MFKIRKITWLLALTLILLVGCSPAPKVGGLGGDEQVYSPYDVSIEHAMIATTTAPNFAIYSVDLINCVGQDYIVIQVRNWGPYYFQRAAMSATSGSDTWTIWPGDYSPFHFSSNECPLGGGHSGLAPGASAYVYLPVDHDIGNNLYTGWVRLCTYVGDPPSYQDACLFRYFELTVEFPWWQHVFIEIAREGPCDIGPGPLKFEVIRTLREGEVLELIGVGDVPGYKILFDPKYQVACWFPEEWVNSPDEEADGSRDEEFESPPEEIVCPKGEVYSNKEGECVKREKGEEGCGQYGDVRACTAAPGCKWNYNTNSCDG